MVQPGDLLRPHCHPRCRTRRPAVARRLFHPSANRDEKVFADPFASTSGDHRTLTLPSAAAECTSVCLGASLARTELRVMIGALLRRFDVIEIVREPVWMSAGPAAAVGVAVQSFARPAGVADQGSQCHAFSAIHAVVKRCPAGMLSAKPAAIDFSNLPPTSGILTFNRTV